MNRESKHTPGPWRVSSKYLIFPSLTGDMIASVSGTRETLDEAHANAHLIAAAPELLAALEEIVAVFDPDCERGEVAQDAALRAITKAKGDIQ